MTTRQLIEIAKVAYGQHALQMTDFDNYISFKHKGKYYLQYKKDAGWIINKIPTHYLFRVHIVRDNQFIEFYSPTYTMNHYKAIKKIEELGIL